MQIQRRSCGDGTATPSDAVRGLMDRGGLAFQNRPVRPPVTRDPIALTGCAAAPGGGQRMPERSI